MSDTRITDIHAFALAPQCNIVVVRVDTNQSGLYGLGCATFTQRYEAVLTAVNDYLRPLMIGKDAANIEDNWNLMNVNPYWRSGPVLNNAISGVDMALWDILGKEANMPVYRLLGGKSRPAVSVYRHANGRDVVELEDEVRAFMEKGYQYIRCQLGGYGGKGQSWLKNPEGIPEDNALFDAKAYKRSVPMMFEHIRNKIGPEVELLHDVHERLTPIDAVNLAKELEQYKLFFLEDVLPPEQGDWFRMIRKQCATPIAMGELYNNPMEYKAMIAERLIDFVRCHISDIGGLTPALKLAHMCEAFGVRTAWHGPGDVSPIGHACNIHLDLALNNFGIQEWCGIDENEPLNEVFSGIPQVRDGFVWANDKPGFGIDMDFEKAKKYPPKIDVPMWTRTRLPDGTVVTP